MKDRFFNLSVGFPLLSMTAAILRGILSTRFWKIWTSILYHSSWSICFLAMVYETKSLFLIITKMFNWIHIKALDSQERLIILFPSFLLFTTLAVWMGGQHYTKCKNLNLLKFLLKALIDKKFLLTKNYFFTIEYI